MFFMKLCPNWQKQIVEEGQVICYIEMLGVDVAIEVCVSSKLLCGSDVYLI